MQRNDAPGSEVPLGEILEHRLFQLRLRQKLPLLQRSLRLEPGVLALQLGQSLGLLGLHAAVLLPAAVVRRLCHLDDAANVGDGIALSDQLLGGPLLRRCLGLELADDLLRCVPGAFHGRVTDPVWPAQDSHSPWTGFRGPRQDPVIASTWSH